MQNLNWFPGHMAKASRELKEKIKLVDLIIELKDARIPFASSNPLLNDLIKDKARLVILCKANMADKKVTKEFLNYYENNNIIALDVDLVDGNNVKEIPNYIRKASESILEKRKKKGIINKEIKIMVVGIPNVGKSTFINKVAGRRSLNVGNRPGVTKSTNVWIKISNECLLLDTPGILWPKFTSEVGAKLALCGSIKTELLPTMDLCYYAIDYLKEYYGDLLKARYSLEDLGSSEEIIDNIGRNRGCLRKGGLIDYNKVYRLILDDIKNSKLGAISYERVS